MLKEGADSRHAAEAAQRVGSAGPNHQEAAREVVLADAGQLDGLAEAPIDWSLKTSLRFSSPAPFRCVEQAGRSRTGTGALGVVQPGVLLTAHTSGCATLCLLRQGLPAVCSSASVFHLAASPFQVWRGAQPPWDTSACDL